MELIIEKIRKIRVLAEQGIDGEAEAAKFVYPVTGEIAGRLGDFPEKIIVKRFSILFGPGISLDFSDVTVGLIIRLLDMYPEDMLVIRFVIELVDKQGHPVKIEF